MVTTNYKHTVNATETHGDYGVSLPCHSCLIRHSFNCVWKTATVLCEFFLACCEIVVCLFRLGFTNFCAKRLQIIARMTEGSLPRAFRDICQQTTLAASESQFLLPFSVTFTSILPPVPANERNMAVAIKESEAGSSLVVCKRNLQPIHLRRVSGILVLWHSRVIWTCSKHLKRYRHRRSTLHQSVAPLPTFLLDHSKTKLQS